MHWSVPLADIVGSAEGERIAWKLGGSFSGIAWAIWFCPGWYRVEN